MTKKYRTKKWKYLFLSLGLICILGFIISSSKINTYQAIISNIFSNNEEIGLNAKVTSSTIIQRKTGTGPFDSDDNPGNDSSEDNDIVRTFDQVTWTIENTMNLKAGIETGTYRGGVIDIKAELPSTLSNYVNWDLASMQWAENATVSSDGTTFTAKYSMSETDITVPGKQTLVFVLKILGAPNGLDIIPTFSFNLQGNSTDEVVTITDAPIYISATPKIDIELRNYNVAYSVTRNDEAKKIYKYALAFRLLGDNASKGLKGIEVPVGDLTFDIQYNMKRKDIEGTEYTDITDSLRLYNYKYSLGNSNVLGNPNNIITDLPSLAYFSTGAYPYSSGSNRRTAVYKNGNLLMVDDGEGTIHTTISNYGISSQFPDRTDWGSYSDDSGYSFEKNIGFISIGMFYMEVDMNDITTKENTQSYIELNATNVSVETIGNEICTSERNTSNNKITANHIIYGPGSYSKEVHFYSNAGAYLASPWGAGNSSMYVGNKVQVRNRIIISENNDEKDWIYGADCLLKFDDKVFEPTLLDNGTEYSSYGEYGACDMTYNILYAGKEDKTGWNSDTEMIETSMEDLIYFDTYRELEEAGYRCVGALAESQGGVIKSGINSCIIIPLYVRADAQINAVGQVVNDVRIYTKENTPDRTTQTHVLTTDINDYPTIRWKSEHLRYVKTEYNDNGQIISGTHGGGIIYGNSLLILGASQSISIKAVDENRNVKVNYDIGKNENIVEYQVTPSISSTSIAITNITLKITSILPKGITYVPGSSEYGEPEKTENADGTTTLVWYKYNCTAGQSIESIFYKAHINEETDNGVQYQVKAIVEEVIGDDGISKIGNRNLQERTSTTSIQIINLSSYALYKTTTTPIIEVNGDIHFKITMINKTDAAITDFQLLDILPYNGDTLGSNFDGTYTLSKIILTGVNANTSEIIDNDRLNLYITNDDTVRSDITVKDSGLGTTSIWERITSEQEINKASKGIALTGIIDAREKLEIDIYLKTNTNKPKNLYKNMATAQTNKDTEAMRSPIVDVQVIKRTLSGKVWLDSVKNGVIDEGETYFSNATVTLLNEDGTIAKDINGNQIAPIITDTTGIYKFEDMTKGNYTVKIEYDDEDGIKEITEKNIGSNKEINSKFNANGSTDLITGLNSIESPELKVENQNAGITYKDTSVIVHHYIDGTTTKLSEDVLIEGKVKDEYTTNVANDISERYEIVAMPENYQGEMKLEQIEVTYYYKLKYCKYTVNYLEKDTNNVLHTQKTAQKIFGDTVTSEDEIIPINNYRYYSVDKDSLTISDDESQNIINIYYIAQGYIEVTKKDSINSSRLLAYAKFGIFSDEACTNKVTEITTNSNGKARTEKLDIGTYYLKEIEAPSNYKINEEVRKCVIETAGQIATTELTNIPQGYIEITKKDNITNNVLANAKYGVYRDSNCLIKVSEITTESDGKARTGLLDAGTYYLKEIEAPENYELSTEVKGFVVRDAGVILTTDFKDTPLGYIEITKKDNETDALLENAKFEIYSNSGLTNKVTELTTGASGKAKTGLLAAGTYYIKETEAPDNYKINTDIKTAIVRNAGATVDVEVKDVPFGYIEVTKKDNETAETLANATIGIYKDSNCTTVATTLTTGANGKAKTGLLDAGTYYVKEITAPEHYNLNVEVQSIRVYQSGQTASVEIKNIPNRGKITAVKKDSLTGRIITKESATFALYEWSVSENNWVKPTHIKENEFDGLVSDGKGYQLKEKIEGTKGTYQTGNLYYNAENLGKFKVVEYDSPYGYTLATQEKEIVIVSDLQEESKDFLDEEIKGTVNLKKLDSEINYKKYVENTAQGEATLEGARYGLYAKEDIKAPDTGLLIYRAGTLIEEKITDGEGKATWDNKYLGKYYIKEITASNGYLLDEIEHEVDLDSYYRNNIYNQNDRTTQNVVYQSSETDSLYENPEKYVVSKEKVKKQAIRIQKITSNIDFSDENVKVQGATFKAYWVSKLDVEYNCTYADIMNQYYHKETHTYNLPESAEAITFRTNADGELISDMVTDENGELITEPLAYGKYVLIEVAGAKDRQVEGELATNLELARPFFVTISENSTIPQDERIITDPHMSAFLEVQKKDTRTGKIVKKAGAKYLINKITTSNREIDGEVLTREPVTQTVSYPNIETIGTQENPYTTGEDGTFITPVSLNVGIYELVEISAPEGYVLSGYEAYTENGELKQGYISNGQKITQTQKITKFKVATTEVYVEDESLATESYNGGNKNGNKIIIEQFNSPQMGTLTLKKTGEKASTASINSEGKYEISYSQAPIEGAKFSVYAEEDIYTNDNQTDLSGNRIKYYSKDQKVQDITTNSEGLAYIDNLPLGKYYIKENVAGEGFLLNNQIKHFEISKETLDASEIIENELQKTAINTEKVEYTNERQKVAISITKVDKDDTNKKLQNAEFRIYAAEDIKNYNNQVIITKDSVVGIATTGSNGVATFTEDLPLGKYYLKEQVSPYGYKLRENSFEFTASYIGQNKAKVEITGQIVNERKDTKVIVHHYIEGTTTKLSEDVEISGKVFDTYQTHIATDIPEYYEVVEIPSNESGEMTEEDIIVTYYYKLKKYNAVINYLEKDNDEDNSNNKVLHEPTIIPNQTYETQITSEDKIIEIPGYDFVEVDKDVLIIGTDESKNVINIYYTRTPAKVTVNHIDKITGDLLKTETTDGYVGDEFTGHSKNFENYVLVEKPNEETIIMEKDEKVLNYYYTHVSAGIIEKHIDIITGDILANDTQEGKEGDPYTTKEKEYKENDETTSIFKDYDLVRERYPENAEGTMTREEEPIEVLYYYIHKAKVIVKHIDRAIGEEIIEEELINGHEKDSYTTKEKVYDEEDEKTYNFKDYTLVQEQYPENNQGDMTRDAITVIYYYKHSSSGVIEKHIDIKKGEDLATEKYEGYEGDPYTTKEKEYKEDDETTSIFKDYDLVREKYPENAEGTMTIDEIEVDYYYIKKSEVVIKYIDKNTGEEIAEEDIIKGHEGDKYKTTPQDIEDYVLVKEELPENAEGEMKNTKAEVKYYYVHKSSGVRADYYDISNGEKVEEEEILQGNEGDKYKTTEKSIEGYDIVKEKYPENAEGTMKIELIQVDYYYIKKTDVITKHIDEETGEELVQEEVTKGHEGDEYKTEPKDIKYYKPIKEKYPENADGKMTVKITEVKYYYKKMTFNLSLDKKIKSVNINGAIREENKDLSKVDIYRKKINSTSVEVTYSIKVTNSGEIEGTAEIKEKIPDGMTMDSSKNNGWKISETEASITTDTIKPGETKEYLVVMDWNTSAENLDTITNVAEIISTENEANYKDNTAEDNRSSADLIITIATGEQTIIQILIGITMILISSGMLIGVKKCQ